MVLAACSDYFYRLFKDLPEKHPVIVFKDASEQILNDLLEFMYRGEVEVDEANLSDFLKFADTLQVKGLSQGDGNPAWKGKEEPDVSSSNKVPPFSTSEPNTPRDTPPISIKDPAKLGSLPEPVASMNKAYHFTSALAGLPTHPLPLDLSYGNIKDDHDHDDIAEHSPSPTEMHENGSVDENSRPMELNLNTSEADKSANNSISTSRKPQGRGSRLERMIAAEYKILSEYSETQNNGSNVPEALPAITPELMKSRRTHSLQLAIGEILHNHASFRSAATKYHIPRETLRRHYQRYLKAMGIQKQETIPTGRQSATPIKVSSIETLAAAAAATASNEESSNYSSLLDFGQAYGIWNPSEDNSNDLSGPRDLKIVEDEDDDISTDKDTPEPQMIKIETQVRISLIKYLI